MYQYALHNYDAEGYFPECQMAAKPWVHLTLLWNQWNNEHVKYFKNINMINCVRHDEDQDVRATRNAWLAVALPHNDIPEMLLVFMVLWVSQ